MPNVKLLQRQMLDQIHQLEKLNQDHNMLSDQVTQEINNINNNINDMQQDMNNHKNDIADLLDNRNSVVAWMSVVAIVTSMVLLLVTLFS